MAEVKIEESNDNEDLLGGYLAEDPSVLTDAQLRKISKTFGIPLAEIKNIAKGMTNARKEIQTEYGS